MERRDVSSRLCRLTEMNLAPLILSLDRLRQDADRNLMPEIAKMYAQSIDRLIKDQVSWDAYLTAFKLAIPKRNGGIDA